MAGYSDKVAKKLYESDFERIKEWKNEAKKPLDNHEIQRLLQLSQQIDELWEQHLGLVLEDHHNTEDPIEVWGQPETSIKPSTRKQKDQIRQKGLLNEDGDIATPFRRLKLVMDYWCSLWFWPIQKSRELPSAPAGGLK